MDNEHRCILLMAFRMHRNTVTRSWGPLLCHSSTTITSCCSMIMHGPMLQGSVHNSWMEAENIPVLAWPAYSPDTSPIEHVWDALDRRIQQRVQFLPISSNFTQPLKRSGPTFHRPQSTTLSTLCKGDVLTMTIYLYSTINFNFRNAISHML